MITISRFASRGTAVLAGLVLLVGFTLPAHAATNQQLEQEIQQLLAEVQALEAQLHGSTAACAFTRDLTVGSSGSDVSCLQNYLISSGYSIPAGATGFFGSETQAAVAAWQAAHGVSPAAGYFGAISRATYESLIAGNPGGGGGGNGGGGGGGGNGGNTANLTNFNLIDRSGNIVDNTDGIKLATAQFDVKGGKVSVSRIDLEFQAQDASEDVGPWTYINSLHVFDGGQDVGSVQAGDQNDWSTNGGGDQRPVYLISVDVNDNIQGGNTADLDIEANSPNIIPNSDNGQSFSMDVPDNGIHATDNNNDQLRTGNDKDTAFFEINGGNGGLSAKDTGNTAVETNEGSTSYGTFTFDFNVTAKGNDIYVPDSIGDAKIVGAGVTYDPNLGNDTAGSDIRSVLNSSANKSGDDFVVRDGDTESFTAQVIIDPAVSGWYEVGLTQLQFSLKQDGSLNSLNLNGSQWDTNQLYIQS